MELQELLWNSRNSMELQELPAGTETLLQVLFQNPEYFINFLVKLK
jgi:hypothetical protein